MKTLLTSSLMILSLVCSASAEDALAKGKEIFMGTGACASCHGDLGKGDGPASAALTPKPADFSTGAFKYDTDGDGKKGTEEDIFNVVTNGAAKFGGSFFMAARADLPEADRRALAKYVASLAAAGK